MTSEKPPIPGLTRIDTGYPHPHYVGWWITPAEMRRIRARMKAFEEARAQAITDLPDAPGATLTCRECGEAFTPAMNRADLCPRCRALRQHARARARGQSSSGG